MSVSNPNSEQDSVLDRMEQTSLDRPGITEPFPVCPVLKLEPSRCVRGTADQTDPWSSVRVTLQDQALWQTFHAVGTEMIINKSGRRMFPQCNINVSGLMPFSRYTVMVDLVPADGMRYKWYKDQWAVCGKSEPQPPCVTYIHPDSPALGTHWMKKTIHFRKLKLTNNMLDQSGHIILHSMHRYQPRFHIVQEEIPLALQWSLVQSFTFPETVFVAVTAYQNEKITKLKIDHNPFAKGFRDMEMKNKREQTGRTPSCQNSIFKRRRTDQAWPNPGNTDQAWPNPGNTDQAWPNRGNTDQVRPNRGNTDQARPNRGNTDQARPNRGNTDQVRPNQGSNDPKECCEDAGSKGTSRDLDRILLDQHAGWYGQERCPVPNMAPRSGEEDEACAVDQLHSPPVSYPLCSSSAHQLHPRMEVRNRPSSEGHRAHLDVSAVPMMELSPDVVLGSQQTQDYPGPFNMALNSGSTIRAISHVHGQTAGPLSQWGVPRQDRNELHPNGQSSHLGMEFGCHRVPSYPATSGVMEWNPYPVFPYPCW